MSQDLAAILGGGSTGPSAIPTVAPVVSTIYKDPLEAALRTVYAENPQATPAERLAIASVVRNRANAKKLDVGKIAQEPGQFEVWDDPKGRERVDHLKKGTPEYAALEAEIGPILRGEKPPTVPFTHFYAPAAQQLLGRAKPEWDQGDGQMIGAHSFFTRPYGSNDLAVLTGTEVPPEQAEADYDASFGKLPGDGTELTAGRTGFKRDPEEVLNSQQDKTWNTLNRGGALDEKAPEGSISNPFVLRKGQTEHDNVEPGQFYVGLDGRLARKPGGDKESSVGAGLAQGVADVGLTIGRALPGSEDSSARQALEAQRLTYGAQFGGDTASGLGRFTGQAVASAPILAGAGAVAAPALRAAGPVGAFVAGNAGRAALPEGAGLLANLGRLGVRGASLSASGAGQGAGGAALMSSASDNPFIQQVGEGAIGGAVAGPVVPAVIGAGQWAGNTVRDLVQPLTSKGRGQIVNRIIGEFGKDAPITPDASEIIPGSVPTLAMSTANPGIATLERTVRLARPTPFAERAAQNADARGTALDTVRGDEQTVADLVSSRNALLDQARTRAFGETADTDPAPLVQAIDAALEAPEAHMEEVAAPLQALRDKLITPPADTSPEQRAAFNRAVAATFGADAPALTPEVLSEARSRLGSKFEEIASKTTVPWDDKLRADVGQILQDTAQVVPEGSLPPLFKQLDNIASTANDGKTISGASYQALTKKGAPLDALMNSADPTIRQAAGRIREALDDALERNLGATPAEPNALEELRAARLQYKNLKTAEAALKQAGPDKQVSPQAVMSAVKRNFGQYAYKGGGGLGDAAEAALKEEAGRTPTVQRDPRQIFGMRQSLDAAIDKLEAKGTDASHAAAEHLRGVQAAMDATIEGGAPGYREYLDVATRSREPLDAQRYLQSMRLTDASGKITLAKVDNALRRISEARAKPGKNAAKSVSDATLAQLEAIRADLLRENNINLGRPLGSDTAQHIVTGNIAGNMKAPLGLGAGAALSGHPIVGAALGAGKLFYGMKNEQVLDQLANRLLQPEGLPARPLKKVRPSGQVPRLAAPVVPMIGGMVANRLLGQ